MRCNNPDISRSLLNRAMEVLSPAFRPPCARFVGSVAWGHHLHDHTFITDRYLLVHHRHHHRNDASDNLSPQVVPKKMRAVVLLESSRLEECSGYSFSFFL